MRSRRSPGTVASMLLLAAVAGCATPAEDATAWSDRVCGALAGFIEAVTSEPAFDTADPVARVRDVRTYLDSAAAAVALSITGLEAAGASPLDGGDEYVTRLTGTLTQIGTGFVTARDRLAEVDTSSIGTVDAALPVALAPLGQLQNLADPTEGLRSSVELRGATDRAPNCRALHATG